LLTLCTAVENGKISELRRFALDANLPRTLGMRFICGSFPCSTTGREQGFGDGALRMRTELLTRIVVANAIALVFALIAASISAAHSAGALPL
jgi:hypothetical protein